MLSGFYKYLLEKKTLIIFLIPPTLLFLILAFLPFKFWMSNVAFFLFLLIFFLKIKLFKFQFNLTLFVSVLLFALMCCSLVWTNNKEATILSLVKNLPFILLPIAFMCNPNIIEKSKLFIIRNYSLSMVGYAIFCFLHSTFRFLQTTNKDVFLFHELVSLDVNAIYIACFASFCLFYFIQIKNKKLIDFISIYILSFFVVLLASKTIIFIDVCLLIWFYVKYANISKSVKFVTIAMASTFVFLSITYVNQLQKRVLEEYETAFVDNTVNNVFGTTKNKVYNISIRQAWSKKKFNPEDFLPGTAFRVFHIRIFEEMLSEQKVFFNGFGQDASTEAIKSKYRKYKMFSNLTYYHFHNQFIQFFAELGYFGLILFFAMIFFNFRTAFANNDFLHTVFAFSTFILFLTESMLIRQRGILFFITLYCLFNNKMKKRM